MGADKEELLAKRLWYAAGDPREKNESRFQLLEKGVMAL